MPFRREKCNFALTCSRCNIRARFAISNLSVLDVTLIQHRNTSMCFHVTKRKTCCLFQIGGNLRAHPGCGFQDVDAEGYPVRAELDWLKGWFPEFPRVLALYPSRSDRCFESIAKDYRARVRFSLAESLILVSNR